MTITGRYILFFCLCPNSIERSVRSLLSGCTGFKYIRSGRFVFIGCQNPTHKDVMILTCSRRTKCLVAQTRNSIVVSCLHLCIKPPEFVDILILRNLSYFNLFVINLVLTDPERQVFAIICQRKRIPVSNHILTKFCSPSAFISFLLSLLRIRTFVISFNNHAILIESLDICIT